MLVHLKVCKLHSCALWMCLYALLQTWCVSGRMLNGVVLSYIPPEWDRVSVLSFIMQLDDSSCDNPWLSTKLPRWPNLPRASHLHPPVPLCWLVCLSVCGPGWILRGWRMGRMASWTRLNLGAGPLRICTIRLNPSATRWCALPASLSSGTYG